jgi:hypothetical protein
MVFVGEKNKQVMKLLKKIVKLRAFIDPAIVMYRFILSIMFVIVCGLLCGSEYVQVCL